jgi:phage-related protein
MPSIGARCHELRVRDQQKNWRFIYRIDPDAIVILEVFQKTTRTTPAGVLAVCRRRLRVYDEIGD